MAILAPSKDRRAAPRTRDKDFRVLVCDPEDALNEPYPAWIIDHSAGGVRLSFDSSKVDVGEILVLRPPFSAAELEVLVRNRRRRDGRVEFGCQFAQADSWAALRAGRATLNAVTC